MLLIWQPSIHYICNVFTSVWCACTSSQMFFLKSRVNHQHSAFLQFKLVLFLKILRENTIEEFCLLLHGLELAHLNFILDDRSVVTSDWRCHKCHCLNFHYCVTRFCRCSLVLNLQTFKSPSIGGDLEVRGLEVRD